MKKKKNYTRTDKAAYFFLLPAAVIYLSVIVAPVCYSFFISLFKWNGIGEKQFVGLSNYINLFEGDKIFQPDLDCFDYICDHDHCTALCSDTEQAV